MIKQTFEKLFFILIAATVLWSCSAERKLATEFAKTGIKRSVLLFVPDLVFKSNIKEGILDSLGIVDETRFDSVLLANSVVLKDINDSLLISNYILGMKREFKNFDFDVYTADQTAEFLEVDSNAYVVYLAQIEVEEAYFPTRDETVISNTYYYHDHILNALTVNSWFEISKVNEETNKQQVYFSSDVITDELDGEFIYDYFGGQLKYLYEVDSLQPSDLYNFAYLLGRTYAGYTFDLLLNRYLKSNLPEEKRSGKYYRYDPLNRSFFPALDDKFIPLEQ